MFWGRQATAAAKSLQSCPTLCDPIDGSPPGSPVPGILQARTLEWVAISFSNAWKWKVKIESEVAQVVYLKVIQSCLTPSNPMDCSLQGSSVHGIFQAKVREWGAIAFSDVPIHRIINDLFYLCQHCTFMTLSFHCFPCFCIGPLFFFQWVYFFLSRFNARYWMLGAGALGRPRGMVWGGRRKEGSGWGTHVYLWRIHFDIWQN